MGDTLVGKALRRKLYMDEDRQLAKLGVILLS